VRWIGLTGFVGVILLLGARQMPVFLALAAGGLAMIVSGLIQSWRTGWSLRWLGVVAFSAVVLQGVLGGLRVVWAQDELGVFHAALAQAFLVLLGVIAMMTGRRWVTGSGGEPLGALPDAAAKPPVMPVGIARLLLLTTVLIFVQLLIGAMMRHQHAGLAIPDFPLAYGHVWPDLSAEAVARYNQQRVETVAVNPITSFQIQLQMAHRILAVVVVGLVLWVSLRLLQVTPRGQLIRRLAGVWMMLIVVQFGLGAWTIWSGKAADIASLHVMGGALSLVTGGLMCVISGRFRASEANGRARVTPDVCVSLPGQEAGAGAK